jgi:hypothetical protein
MSVSALAVFASLALQASPPANCSDARQCRQMALEAAEKHEYERFHDLAWRAVQTGSPRDTTLMYLLARAQSLSGRPHDALVTLQRLAGMGVFTDAATNDDFKRTRDLPGWPEVAAQIERLQPPGVAAAAAPSANLTSPTGTTPGASVPPAATPAPSLPPAPPARAPGAATATVTPPAAPTNAAPSVQPGVAEAVRFSSAPFAVGGLAYDAVSGRFLFGDRAGRRLIVVGERSGQPSDLVHGDSAGFREISAIEIDGKRGDLWVATAAAGGGAGALHRLQLVSGRPLKAYPIDSSLEPVSLVDLAITPAGGVLVLDSTGRQLLGLNVGGTSPERLVQLGNEEPVSVAAPDRDGVAYVAYRDGIARIDLRAHTVKPVTVAKGVALGRLERIRWYRNALVALTTIDDERRIVRLELNGRGDGVTRASTLRAPVSPDAQAFVAIAGDDFIYMESTSKDSTNLSELVAYRVHLR